jgi:type I restriction enzyme S subunit
MSSEDYEFLGFSALVQSIPPSTYLNSFCKGFRPTTAGCCPEFLNYYCRSRVGRALISSLGFGFTRINLRTGALLSVQVLCPPLPEQRAIAAFLDRETATIDGLVNEAQSAITLLTERRSALISAAVTGQIDVRNAVPKEAA